MTWIVLASGANQRMLGSRNCIEGNVHGRKRSPVSRHCLLCWLVLLVFTWVFTGPAMSWAPTCLVVVGWLYRFACTWH